MKDSQTEQTNNDKVALLLVEDKGNIFFSFKVTAFIFWKVISFPNRVFILIFIISKFLMVAFWID